MTTPREKYERRRETFDEYVRQGEIGPATGDAVPELCDAYDDHNIMIAPPKGEGTREVGTIMSWLYRLMQFARQIDLTTTSTDELKREIQRMHDGTHPHVKDEGLKKSTLRSYQAALRKFYSYHDFGIDPNDIPIFDKTDSHVDPSDMLTKEEIHEARNAANNPRDRLIFDLLLYTGQRREALRTLRLKDVNPQEGTYRLNPTVDGLKGAQDRNGIRPLLGARAAIQSWLDYHPDASNPEHYLITARPGYSQVDPSQPVSGETIRKVMSNIKERAEIAKPMHPHALRHNFVTIAKRDYELPDDTVKYLIGHTADSTVMETTYSHLSGDDHVQRAEEAWGIRDPEEESPLTPDVCNVCGNPLDPNAKACARCGTVYTPDAQSVQEQIQQDMKNSYRAVDPDDMERQDNLDTLDELLEHPDIKAALIDRISEK
jgi:integrase